ncbi:3'(2'),5'-bisphosphate nucleotidase CysQ [Autumnicola edwardsiae]|uniref:3'(2'),5'-bisphosphate nucleotidase CysQ n=1 Tax=Autumnicola edwardsiae TaxID=3075594 RepID=A0ABU3CZK0_9FLAO|nr:3'(2'),5'-bisphosphate nucleotidase CysQ [Zunongwangia sp. F297]MDT0651721.1 3'(2'),5'-bisphosphate nucleotidase CysQ [Zunongwangia sp. F297]
MTLLLETAIQASLAAGKRIMQIYENEDFEVEAKEDKSPLTKADKASHDIITSYLEKLEFPVLSEEGKHLPYEQRKNWSKLWIVDPIDGTKEFIKRNGEFTVNIALVEDQKPVLGVIYVPALEDLYFAAKGVGSFKINAITEFSGYQEVLKMAIKLPVSSERKTFTVVASKSHLSSETKEYIKSLESENGKVDTISVGSSLKLCMVAEGKADCYPRFAPTMEWDTAAGQAICAFAGKKVFDYKTKEEMLYNRENLRNNWFLVTNGESL